MKISEYILRYFVNRQADVTDRQTDTQECTCNNPAPAELIPTDPK